MKELYVLSDQPTVCPLCGSRTAFTEEEVDNTKLIQYHSCLNLSCLFRFTVVED